MCRLRRRRSWASPARFVAPRDFIWNDDLPLDLDGHGTHVAGTVGQLTNNGIGVAGMAYNVRIMPVKVIQGLWDEIFGSPFDGTDDVVARAIRYAADNGAKVINMSIGREEGGPATAVTDAIRYAVSKGVFVASRRATTAAAATSRIGSAESAPRIDGMVAVGAVGRDARSRVLFDDRLVRRALGAGRRSAASAATGGILQQTLDQDLSMTYELGRSRSRPPRVRRLPLLLLPGHVDGHAARLRIRGAADAARHHRARRRSKPP